MYFGCKLSAALLLTVFLCGPALADGAAEALDIGARCMVSLSPDVAREALKLGEKDIPACVMPIGGRAKR